MRPVNIRMTSRVHLLPFLGAAAIALATGCNDPTDAADDAWTLSLVSPDNQAGAAGDTLEPILFRVTREDETPVARFGITFTVTEGSASIENAEGNARGSGVGATVQGATDLDGETSLTFVLGHETGLYRVRAVIEHLGDSLVDVTAYASPGPAQQVIRAGDGQVGAAGAELGAPVGVLIRDQFGNEIFQHLVVWTLSSGGGSLDADSVTTNDRGAAYVRWTLGSSPGLQSVTARVEDLGDFLFTATAQ